MLYLSINWEDVAPLVPDVSEARGKILLEDVIARAKNFVPELAGELTDVQSDTARAVIRKAVARWADSGSGGVTTKTKSAGPYQASESYEARGDRPLFYDSEIAELKAIFSPHGTIQKSKAFSIGPAIQNEPFDILSLGW